jgi:hypothetical protein
MANLSKTLGMHSSNLGFKWNFAALPLAVLPVTLWLLMRGYHGLTEDGQIYAFQAFARLHPPLTTDLYLQNTSQDQFTLFSPLYAWCIGPLGLENAARLLTLAFTIWFLAAAWNFVRSVTGREAAWLGVVFLLIIAGNYGASGVFRILDPFLTARLPAEALIITALGCHVRGRTRLGLLLALGAMFVHPLMALPGLLLIVFLSVPARVSVIGAVGCVFATLAAAVAAANLPRGLHLLAIMDPSWLEVVRERSQFLFLQLWSIRDWDINALPFISLGFTAIAITDDRIRRLCAVAALVGVAGLATAFIGDVIGPVAIFVQGQAWRWVWIAAFIGAALVPATVLRVWREEKCGPLCALLLVSGWTLPGIDGAACVTLPLMLWLARAHINARLTTPLRWVTAALGVVIVVWTSMKLWTVVSSPTHPLGPARMGAVQLQDVFALRIPAVLLGVLVYGSRDRWTTWMPTLISMLLVALSICAFPGAFKQLRTLATVADIHEFEDWANAIPPTSTVLVAPPRDVGGFVWFTLGRPNYLALDQSSGVVFSRATALEVRRRSEVLLPLMNPDWKIRTGLRAKSSGQGKNESATRPLTAENLIRVCADPQLGFARKSRIRTNAS